MQQLQSKSPQGRLGVFKMADIFAAIDMTSATAAVVGILVLGIGIHLAFGGARLGKKGISTATR